MQDSDGEASDPGGSTARRGFLTAIVGGAAYALGWLTNGVAAQSQTLAGDVANQSEPANRVYVDKLNFNARTSDPSSPDDGTMWYNEDA